MLKVFAVILFLSLSGCAAIQREIALQEYEDQVWRDQEFQAALAVHQLCPECKKTETGWIKPKP